MGSWSIGVNRGLIVFKVMIFRLQIAIRFVSDQGCIRLESNVKQISLAFERRVKFTATNRRDRSPRDDAFKPNSERNCDLHDRRTV